MRIAWHCTPDEAAEVFGPVNGSIVVCEGRRIEMHVFYSRFHGWEVARDHAEPGDEEDERRKQDTCLALLSSSLPDRSDQPRFVVEGMAAARIGHVIDALGEGLPCPRLVPQARLTCFWMPHGRYVPYGNPSGIIAYVLPDGKHHVHVVHSQRQAWQIVADAVWLAPTLREQMMHRVALSLIPLEGEAGPTVNGYTAALLGGAFELATLRTRLPTH